MSMEKQTKKKALVLAGGGTRGIYQAGVLQALQELGEDDFNMVFGVSVGALNAAMIAQGDIDRMNHMYDHLTADQIVNGFIPNENMSLGEIVSERKEFIPQLKYYINNKGIDITPFIEMTHEYYNAEKMLQSSIRFYCVTALAKDHSGVLVNKEMMKEHGEDWLVASASAYPAFPIKNIDGVEYVDGGYFDNFPIDYALQEGAEEIIGIDLGEEPIHPLYLNKEGIVYIHPHEELYYFLSFDQSEMQTAKVLGYNDTMKAYGKYEGWKYTFHPFEFPSYWQEYFRDLLMLETRIKVATPINEKLRSDTTITNMLKTQMHVTDLTTKQYLYGIMDSLLTMCNVDSRNVWDYEQAMKLILAGFAECAYENYAYKPSGLTDIAGYLKSLNKKGVVEKIVHANLYPNDRLFSDQTMLTLYPFEVALGNYVTIAMKNLVE